MIALQNYPRLTLIALGIIVLGSAYGQRLPWHIDEVRFVGVALEMMQNGNWLVPHRAGEIYADKPPVFFWLLALLLELTHSVRWSFLLPGIISGVACLLLVHDLGKRWWNSQVGFCAAILLLGTYQFWRICTAAHIDGFLVLCTTLGVYGLARHLYSGKDLIWFFIGFLAMGIGTTSKGVGFLPLLLVIPFALLRWRGDLKTSIPGWQWLAGIALMLGIVLCWLLPLLIKADGDAEIQQYLDNILFQQTGKRYVDAWQHREPFWFFIAALPKYWAPLSLLLPWLIPAWYRRLRRADPRYVLLLSWAVMVIIFFSASTGKRELYILPALPAVALAAAPVVLVLIRQRWLQRVASIAIWTLLCVLSIAAVVRVFNLLPDSRLASWPVDTGWTLLIMAAVATITTAFILRRRANPILAFMITYGLLIVFYHRALVPLLDDSHSGKAAMNALGEAAAPHSIALIEWNERNWLYATAPLVHNGKRSDLQGSLCSNAEGAFMWLMSLERANKTGLTPKETFSLERKKLTALIEPRKNIDCPAITPFKFRFQWNERTLRMLDN